MAEGGGEFGYDDPELQEQLDHDDDDEEQETDRTRPFQPGAASTPYHGGETIEMQTRQHEKTGLSLRPETSYQETSDTTRPWFAPCVKRKSVDGSVPNSSHSLLYEATITELIERQIFWQSAYPRNTS